MCDIAYVVRRLGTFPLLAFASGIVRAPPTPLRSGRHLSAVFK